MKEAKQLKSQLVKALKAERKLLREERTILKLYQRLELVENEKFKVQETSAHLHRKMDDKLPFDQRGMLKSTS